jgi:ppGpp synthetase/RelA/SpoT-type nucleotidyltranferase
VSLPNQKLSISQINKLGDRLRLSGAPSEGDLLLLQNFSSSHDATLLRVAESLRKQNLQVTTRIKTVNTIIEKLRRSKTRLSRMQDIAGARIVQEDTLVEQDALVLRVLFDLRALSTGSEPVESLSVSFGSVEEWISFARTSAKRLADLWGIGLDDRRTAPMHGYRAVHLVAAIDGQNIEVQIRTRLQDAWAQTFEKMSDLWGRDVRYGLVPDDPAQADAVDKMQQLSQLIRQAEEIEETTATWVDVYNDTPGFGDMRPSEYLPNFPDAQELAKSHIAAAMANLSVLSSIRQQIAATILGIQAAAQESKKP